MIGVQRRDRHAVPVYKVTHRPLGIKSHYERLWILVSCDWFCIAAGKLIPAKEQRA